MIFLRRFPMYLILLDFNRAYLKLKLRLGMFSALLLGMNRLNLIISFLLAAFLASCAGENSIVNNDKEKQKDPLTYNEYSQIKKNDPDFFQAMSEEKFLWFVDLENETEIHDTLDMDSCSEFKLGSVFQASDIPLKMAKNMTTEVLEEAGKLSSKKKKEMFLCYLVPNAIRANWNLMKERYMFIKILYSEESQERSEYLESLFDVYNAKYKKNKSSKEALYKQMSPRLLPVPLALVLAQASLESGWGIASRFARNCNNFYGLHARKRDVIPADCMTKGDDPVKLMVFDSVLESTEAYLLRLNSGINTYKSFRAKRYEMFKRRKPNSKALTFKLKEYAANENYGPHLRKMIQSNHYNKYDLIFGFEDMDSIFFETNSVK